MKEVVAPKFFATPASFRTWLAKNHASKTELLVGFHKRDSGKKSITWPESVDEALCFGWIDGVRKNLNETSYTIRFTPRKPVSNWSAVNIKRVAELTEAGLMQPAGLTAFERRTDAKSRIYSYENRKEQDFLPEQKQLFQANKKAWAFFEKQAPSYKHLIIFWAIGAKREETRDKRMAKLIDASAQGKRVV